MVEGIVSKAYFDIKSVDHRLSYIVKSGSLVLDVGCGNGIDVLRIAERGAFVVGIDLGDEVPLTQALENAKTLKQDQKVCFIIASATNIPFKDEAFNVTTSFSVIDHLPNKLITLAVQEMARVTMREGFVVITVPNILFIVGTISRWILSATKTGTFLEKRFSPGELRKMLSKSGLQVLRFDSEWPRAIERITLDNRLPPILRKKVPMQVISPFLKIFGFLAGLSILKVCGARMGFLAKKKTPTT